MESSVPGPDEMRLLTSRAAVGLRVVFVALALFTAADARLVSDARHATMLVRAVQFGLVALAAVSLRFGLSMRWRVTAIVFFLSGIYVSSAVAGMLRGSVATQPVTDLAIAFATATTLPWGALPQLVTVLVAMLAIAADAWVVDGALLTSPHMAAGLAVSFLVSVYIAHQLQTYRRERDAAEAALRRNEERFRSLVERGSDIITIVDSDGIVRYDSPPIARVLGFAADARVGTPVSRYVHPDDMLAVAAAVTAASQGRPASVECRVARADGSWCDVESWITDLRDHPAVGGIVSNWRDVSERKRAEEERRRHTAELARARDQALASTRAKSAFLANMSHEIRTPLNVVIGLADMVLDASLAPEQHANVERIRGAATGLLGVINDILDASKIEAGKMTITVVDMDLRATVDEAVALLAPAAAGKGLALTATVAPDVPPRLKGDPMRVRQTLVNLLGNAVKFTETGSIDVAVRVVRRTSGHVTMHLGVRDTGIGIPADRHAGIFESFAQADESVARVYGGTGLGLAISRQLVTLMGGRMGLESAPGRGSTFWFELTLECPSLDAAAA